MTLLECIILSGVALSEVLKLASCLQNKKMYFFFSIVLVSRQHISSKNLPLSQILDNS